MDRTNADISRRKALGVLSGALTVGLSGCSGGSDDDQTTTAGATPTETAASTPTPTAPMDPPNIERQTVLRDKAAIPHIRRTVSGTIEWPEGDTYNLVDTSLLGRWERDSQGLELYDDLTFSTSQSGTVYSGTYYTVPPRQYLRLEYDDGTAYEYFYRFNSGQSPPTLDIYTTENEYLSTYEQTSDRQDNRTVAEAARQQVMYELDNGQTKSRDLTTGSAGTGFIVDPDGYVVTNAHVVGVHNDPEDQLYFQLANNNEQELREAFQESNLSENELQVVVDILLEKLFDYYAEKSTVRSVSTDIGVLSGTATPDEEFSAESWAATVETTGSVYDDVGGEPSWGRDIAVLKVDEQQPLPTVRLGSSTDLGTGAEVFVIGYPDIGLQEMFEERDTTLEPSLTSGVVSARRTLNSGVETIQTDAGINPGNSGGPMYNSDGEVVGIATFRPADVDLEEIAFALPIEIATGFMGELGVENKQSTLSTTYQEGLNALWRDDCETVDEKMDAVLDMWSGHPYAEDIKEQC